MLPNKVFYLATKHGRKSMEEAYGKCDSISLSLWRDLVKFKYKPTIVFGFYTPTEHERKYAHKGYLGTFWRYQPLSHYWIECNGYILDATSLQFGGPSIRIVKVGHKRYKISFRYENIKQFEKEACRDILRMAI